MLLGEKGNKLRFDSSNADICPQLYIGIIHPEVKNGIICCSTVVIMMFGILI
jgi:hypothetical protein